VEFLLYQLNIGCELVGKFNFVDCDPIENLRITENKLYKSPRTYLPKLCKLHGSVNWFKGSGSKIDVLDQILYGEFFSGNRDKFERRFLPYISADEYQFSKQPLLIPPTVFKNQPYAGMHETWSVAGKSIQEADKLIFIGYSFPESDSNMRFIFGKNLAKNVEIQTIDVIDIEADKICKRIKSKYGNRFIQLLNPLEFEWESGKYSIKEGEVPGNNAGIF